MHFVVEQKKCRARHKIHNQQSTNLQFQKIFLKNIQFHA